MPHLVSFIDTGRLATTPGGIHPPTRKARSQGRPVQRLALPPLLYIPLKQHIGDEGELIVAVGDSVLKGQALTKTNNGLSLPVHAPTSGTVHAIAPHTSAHPSALPELCLVLKPDGQDRWQSLTAKPDYQQCDKAELVNLIRQAGIAGMGGAGFPTYVKTAPRRAIKVLIINGVECEPYITADDCLMTQYAADIVQGIQVLQYLVNPERVVIAIEDDKPSAILAMQQATQDTDIIVRAIPTKYPSGGEKQLIQIVTGQEVPSGKLPSDIGVLSQNVGTVYAIGQAVVHGKPLIERIVTVTGETVAEPQNVWALLGTPVRHLLQHAQFTAQPQQRVIMGGPMMGFTLPHLDVPVVKITNCVLAPSAAELPAAGDELACIRCSACAEACPASLLPQQLQWYAKADDHERLQEYNLFDCIECGACAYVCPSEIPLVQYYRIAKADIRQKQDEARKAEQAKLRFEARKLRLEQEMAERKQRQAAMASKTKPAASPDVEQAMARVSNSERDQAVAAAIARAQAKAQSGAAEPDNSEMRELREARKAQARAKREQQGTDAESQQIAATVTTSSEASSSDDGAASNNDKKSAVAAAIARAKAKKAQQNSEPSHNADNSAAQPTKQTSHQATNSAVTDAISDDAGTEQVTSPSADARKSAVAAAVARAKAKKAQAAAEQSGNSEATAHAAETTEPLVAADSPTAPDSENKNDAADPRKVAVAAAIARAKAKKAQASTSTEPLNQEQARVSGAELAAQSLPESPALASEATITTAPDSARDDHSAAPRDDSADPRKAAVAAAIARAKAKKAAQQAAVGENSAASAAAPTMNTDGKLATSEINPDDDSVVPALAATDASTTDAAAAKKAAVARAVAKAKRKAQQAADADKGNDNDL